MISCITITRNRTELLLQCINLFKLQTYVDKEMIIVYYSNDKDTIKIKDVIQENNIIFHEYDVNLKYTLGDIRNYAIEKSNGDYICIWDDDDIYDPLRLEIQMNHLLNEKNKVACTLKREGIFSIVLNKIAISSNRDEGWENSLLCLKSEMPLYAKLNCHEDTPVLLELFKKNKVVSIDYPELYVYVYHGNNTVSFTHFTNITFSFPLLNQLKKIKNNIISLSNIDLY